MKIDKIRKEPNEMTIDKIRKEPNEMTIDKIRKEQNQKSKKSDEEQKMYQNKSKCNNPGRSKRHRVRTVFGR